jgi:BASS family bile acid:Na+ symporter
MTSTNHLAAIVEHLIRRYFIWIISFSYIVAGLRPEFGLWLRGLDLGNIGDSQVALSFPLPSVLLGLLLFNGGLGLKPTELKHLLGKPLIVLGGVAGNLLTPLAFILAISLTMTSWHNPDEAQQILVGLALVASMPIAGASTAWSQNANGNLALSLGLVVFTTALSPFLTPLILHAAGFLTTGDYSEDLHELASGGAISFLGTWIILPSLLGILSRSLLGDRCMAMLMPYLKLSNYCVLVLLNYSNASLALPNVMSQPDKDFLAIILVIVIALCITAFASGYLLARIFRADRKETASLMFGLGMNNNGAGLVLASLELGDHPEVMLPVIFYNLIQHLVASFVDFSMFRPPPHSSAGQGIDARGAAYRSL